MPGMDQGMISAIYSGS